MKLKIFFLLVILSFSNFLFAQNIYQKDFNEFWTTINENDVYLDIQKIDWKKVKEIYESQTEKIKSRDEFIQFLETVLNELYNGHTSLNTNLNSSNKLVPSGQDMYVEKAGNKFIITDVRKGSGAEQSGLRIGMQITAFNGKPVEDQLNKFLPKYTKAHNLKMYQYALDMLFAGTHDMQREITVAENGKVKSYFPDKIEGHANTPLISSSHTATTLYIKINNSLWNNDLIGAFDKTLDSFINYKNIIIDLTETPGGGNTTVARAIMGRFINKTLPYQKHEIDEKEFGTKRVWTEFVIPRKKQFKGNVNVLVGHWTGSMGEGIAIGFDGIKRATIIGTRMAGLLGAISGFQMSETKIGFQFPIERVYHINGTPRENFLPRVLTKNSAETYKKMSDIK